LLSILENDSVARTSRETRCDTLSHGRGRPDGRVVLSC